MHLLQQLLPSLEKQATPRMNPTALSGACVGGDTRFVVGFYSREVFPHLRGR